MIADNSGQILAANIFKKYIKQMPNNSSDKQIRKYLSLDGRESTSNVTNITQGYNNTLYLADGTIVTFGWVYENCANDAIECGDIAVNFPEKTAQLGINRFFFYLSPKGVMPYGHKDHIRSFKDYCDITNSTGKGSNEQGRGCTAWVISNNNMDYLHCTGLDWDSKTSCK